MYSSKQVENARYIITDKLGQGGHGDVFAAVSTKGESVAVKVTSIEDPLSNYSYLREVNFKNIKHPNLVTVLDHYTLDDKWGVLVMERMDMDLMDYILDSPNLSLPELMNIFAEICKAISFLHENRIAHMDIKPENVLLKIVDGKVKEVKLCDFGFAVNWGIGEKPHKRFGTVEYRAPESLSKSRNLNLEKLDVWSLGVLFFVLLTSKYPFVQKSKTVLLSIGINNLEDLMNDKFVCDDEFEALCDSSYQKWVTILQRIFSDPLDRPSVSYIANFLKLSQSTLSEGPSELKAIKPLCDHSKFDTEIKLKKKRANIKKKIIKFFNL